MLTVRRSSERGAGQHGWLDSKHTFSFADYHDPRHMGFRSLRVLNEDRVQAGAGFGTHGHRDMEILSWVLEGGLRHGDNIGNGSVIVPGDLQRMSAGTGVMHSEQNDSKTEGVHFLQIWIVPAKPGQPPGYEQRSFPIAERQGALRLIGSSDGREGSVTIQQDVALYAAVLSPAQRVEHELAPGRHAWIQVTRGSVQLASGGNAPVTLNAGDGASLSDETSCALSGLESSGGGVGSEVLVFDLG